MSSIKQKFAVVEIEPEPAAGLDGRKIVVRRMSAKFARTFLKRLAVVVEVFMKARGDSPDANLGQIVMRNLGSIIEQSDELVDTLCMGSTGLTLDEFGNLDSLAAAEVLRASLAVNFDDELKNSFAGIVGQLAALMPAEKTNSSANSSTT